MIPKELASQIAPAVRSTHFKRCMDIWADNYIELAHREIETTDSMNQAKYLQGKIAVYRQIKKLTEEVKAHYDN